MNYIVLTSTLFEQLALLRFNFSDSQNYHNKLLDIGLQKSKIKTIVNIKDIYTPIISLLAFFLSLSLSVSLCRLPFALCRPSHSAGSLCVFLCILLSQASSLGFSVGQRLSRLSLSSFKPRLYI